MPPELEPVWELLERQALVCPFVQAAVHRVRHGESLDIVVCATLLALSEAYRAQTAAFARALAQSAPLISHGEYGVG